MTEKARTTETQTGFRIVWDVAFSRTESSAVGRWTAILAGAGFLVLALAVYLRLFDAWDAEARQWFRPDDVWGTRQLRADIVVGGLRPERMLPALAVFVAVLCLIRRSLRPAVIAGGAGLLLAVPTIVTKATLAQPDPHQSPAGGGSSFPSGHTATVMVCLGVAVFLLRPGGGWWIWLVPGLAGALMGVCLLIQAAHWATDVLGGALIGVTVLGVVSAIGYPVLSDPKEPSSDPKEPSGPTGPADPRIKTIRRWPAYVGRNDRG